MTTLVDFRPSRNGPPFEFTATLDGDLYSVIACWNLFGQRWYVNVYSLGGSLIVARPMIASPSPRLLAAPASVERIKTITWSDVSGGQLAIEMDEDSILVLGNTMQISGATNSGSGGDSVVNTAFTIDTWTDVRHFTALLNAPAGVVGTIAGSPVLNLEVHSLTWSNSTGRGMVTAHTREPHGIDLGVPTSLVIARVSPSGYNGRHRCLPISDRDFTYPLADDPGTEKLAGSYSPDISMVSGYFSSEMVWRPESSRFEITP